MTKYEVKIIKINCAYLDAGSAEEAISMLEYFMLNGMTEHYDIVHESTSYNAQEVK